MTSTAEFPRLLTPKELVSLIRTMRELLQWSQETLAALSRLSVRTVQRVEKGEPSDLDTRRALARAFESEDLDIFSKPEEWVTDEQAKDQLDKFKRDHVILDARVLTSGRELATLFARGNMDYSSQGVDLEEQPAESFASLLDYLRDYRDGADCYREKDRLSVYRVASK